MKIVVFSEKELNELRNGRELDYSSAEGEKTVYLSEEAYKIKYRNLEKSGKKLAKTEN